MTRLSGCVLDILFFCSSVCVCLVTFIQAVFEQGNRTMRVWRGDCRRNKRAVSLTEKSDNNTDRWVSWKVFINSVKLNS